jgi:hypothetical protein
MTMSNQATAAGNAIAAKSSDGKIQGKNAAKLDC